MERTWWKYIAALCSTSVCSPYSSLLPLYWPSSTPFQPWSLTSVLADSIQDDSVWHSHPTALGFPDRRCHCLALFQILRLPPSHLCCHLQCPSTHSSQANFWCPKWFEVHYLHHFSRLAVDYFDLVLIQYLSSSSSVVLCRYSWWHRGSFRQFKYSHTIMSQLWPGCLDNLFSIWNVSYGCCLVVFSVRFLLCST